MDQAHQRVHEFIAQIVEPKSKVLDLGSGSGELLKRLQTEKQIEGTGVEVSEELVYECVQTGLAVHHGDVDEGLEDFPGDCFDYVILNDTLQEVRKPDLVIQEMLRVGKRSIITFPNFGHWRARLQMLLYGQTPVTPSLPYEWYETPNLHFLSIFDFYRFCKQRNIEIVKTIFSSQGHQIRFMPNLFADTALFVIT